VRELENFIERAIVMGHSGQQLVEEIHRLRRREAADRQGEEKGMFHTSADMTLAELEHAYILRVLDDVEGNQRMASEILGINPSTLWRKMRKYQGEG
jgi:DNA-binding NtrC family response regulator